MQKIRMQKFYFNINSTWKNAKIMHKTRKQQKCKMQKTIIGKMQNVETIKNQNAELQK